MSRPWPSVLVFPLRCVWAMCCLCGCVLWAIDLVEMRNFDYWGAESFPRWYASYATYVMHGLLWIVWFTLGFRTSVARGFAGNPVWLYGHVALTLGCFVAVWFDPV